MKTLIKILFLSFIICSCSNNDDSNNQNDSELILKEVFSTTFYGSDTNSEFMLEKFYYYEDNRPKFYEEYWDESTTDIRTRHYIEYNENNLLDNIHLAIYGEGGFVNYEYGTNGLTSMTWGIGSYENCTITYNNNEITITLTDVYNTEPNEETTYIFNNENYEQIEYSYTISLPPTGNPFPPRKRYVYDSNSNLTSIMHQEYNSITEEYEDISTDISITYDSKKNPYKQTNNSSPVVLHNLVDFNVHTHIPILLNDKISSNNIIMMTKYNQQSNIVTEHEYEYNDLGYPTSSTETITRIGNISQEILYTYSKSKTYTYY